MQKYDYLFSLIIIFTLCNYYYVIYDAELRVHYAKYCHFNFDKDPRGGGTQYMCHTDFRLAAPEPRTKMKKVPGTKI